MEASRGVFTTAALARSEEVKRLSNIGAAIARSVEASAFCAVSGSVVRMGDARRNSIAADERDEAAMRAVLNPDLAAFPRATYPGVLFSTGFRLSIASVPVPQAIEEPDAGAGFNPHHWQILNALEQRLRQVVEQRLEDLSGPNWIRQRVPQTVRERWLARQQEDRVSGRSVYGEIQYADFMDLAVVIAKSDNWREAFQSIFRDRNEIAVSLCRLHPVRKALAHSRPLGRADVLTLVGEATRIFHALGMRVLH